MRLNENFNRFLFGRKRLKERPKNGKKQREGERVMS
jgi:hypothetical protein